MGFPYLWHSVSPSSSTKEERTLVNKTAVIKERFGSDAEALPDRSFTITK
jgi:hypothetical protein